MEEEKKPAAETKEDEISELDLKKVTGAGEFAPQPEPPDAITRPDDQNRLGGTIGTISTIVRR